MKKVKPLKQFGQNYLRDKNIVEKIAGEINPDPEDNLLEIGPGLGSLTGKLFERIKDFTAVEIDNRVIEELSQNYPSLNLIHSDFMDVDLYNVYKHKMKKLRVAGNIPYNLTSPIIFKMIENNEIVSDAVLMVQYEVAKRMVSVKGTKDYGILSVLLKYFSRTKICFKVSPNVFYPKPKVYSAVVHITFIEQKYSKEDQEMFIKIVKAAFGNRRKTLKNSLSNSIFADVNFAASEIDLTQRAEQLDVDDFIKLAIYARNRISGTGTN